MEFQPLCRRLSRVSCTRCLLQARRSTERQVCGVGIGRSVECNEEQGGRAFHRQHREKRLRHGLEGRCHPQVGIVIFLKGDENEDALQPLLSSNSRSCNKKTSRYILSILRPQQIHVKVENNFDDIRSSCHLSSGNI